MSKFSDIKEFLQNKFHKNEELESDDDDTSMAEGVNDKIHGVNKKVVYAILGTLVVAFISFTYFNSSDDSSKKQQQKKQQTQEEADKNLLNNKSGMPNDYEQMQQMNARKAGQPPQQNGPATNTAKNNANGANNSNNNTSNNAANPGSLPAIPQRSSYNSSYQPTYTPPVQIAAPASAMAANQSASAGATGEREKDKYSSAISFGVDKKNNAQEASSGSTAVTPVSSTYTGTGTVNNGLNPLGGNSVLNSGAVPVSSLISGGAQYMAATPNSIQAGTVIPAVLLNGVNTDIGGQVLAQVECDVYDSLTGSTLLIPAGSRLVGSYNGSAKDGQNRVGITWNYLMLPNGGSYSIGNSMIASDGAGYAGLPGKVNRHMGRTMQAGFWSTGLAALGSLASGNTNTTSNTYTPGQLAAQGAMSNLMNMASSLFKKGIDSTTPTITIDPGSEFTVFVTQTIQFNPY